MEVLKEFDPLPSTLSVSPYHLQLDKEMGTSKKLWRAHVPA